MTPDLATPIDIVRRSDQGDPLDDRRLRKAITDGSWVRIAPGAFARAADWHTLKPHERHRTKVLEVMRRLRGPVIIGMFAAAALWGIDVLGAWPTRVDVIRPPANGGRSSGWIRRHPRDVGAIATIPCGQHRVTTPAQTALDLARTQPHVNAVAIVDQAIWTGRKGGALTSLDDIFALWHDGAAHRGNARASRALSFASPLAANVRESQSRVQIARLGFPVPRLQERRVLRTGRLVFGDFYFPSHDHWGELDGHGKYRDAAFTGGRDAAAVVIDEKNRENEIRREVRGFSRWEPADADVPARLYDILTGDGLPSALPRP